MPEAPGPDLRVAASASAAPPVSFGERLTEQRYRLFPDHVVGEILSKGWVDNATPFAFLVIVLALFGALIPDFFSTASLVASGRQLGEFGCVVLGEMVVMVGGGIDLSVGSSFALGNIVALMCMNLAGMPAGAALACTLAACGAVGLLNGVLVGYLRLRAFLTTLVVLIIVRAIVDTLLLRYSVAISTGSSDSEAWDWIGDATLAGVPFSLVVLLALVAAGHVILSRTRPGWHVMAVGGSRPLGLQRRHLGAPHGVRDLRDRRPAGGPGGVPVRGEARQHRVGHRVGARARRADGGDPRRQQPGRRPRLHGEGADGLGHGAGHRERRGAARAPFGRGGRWCSACSCCSRSSSTSAG